MIIFLHSRLVGDRINQLYAYAINELNNVKSKRQITPHHADLKNPC